MCGFPRFLTLTATSAGLSLAAGIIAGTVFLQAAAASASDTSTIRGIYLVVKHDLALSQRGYLQALQSPNVDGAYLQDTWENIEPQKGQFNWSYLDAQLKGVVTLHKKVSLGIWAGAYAPSWLYQEGAQAFHTVVEPKRRPEFCQPITLPVPWDPVFQNEWLKAIRAFGEHYANNPAVVLVKITGVAYRTDETAMPRAHGGTKTNTLTGKSCTLPNDVQAWQAVGYTSEKVESAFRKFATAFAAAFPRQSLAIMTSKKAFPPIGAGGQLDENAVALSTTRFFEFGRDTFGQRFVGQNNGLSELKVEPGVAAFGKTNPIGFQGAGPVTGGAHCNGVRHQARPGCGGPDEMQQLIQNAETAHAQYVELFPADILNPKFSAIFANAHQYFSAAH